MEWRGLDTCDPEQGQEACRDAYINPLNAELYPICHLLALLGAHSIFYVSRKRVNETSGSIKSWTFLDCLEIC